MTHHDRLSLGLQIAARHTQHERDEFALLDQHWDLLPGVFAPTLTESTALFTTWLPYPVGGSLLEVGCGAGVTAVTAALRGCARVTAVDINDAAVRTTRMNAVRHGVADVLHAACGDLFDAVPAGEQYDVIFWNSPVIRVADDVTTDRIQQAIMDPGYQAHGRYLHEGRKRLTAGGRLFLGWNSLGDREMLEDLAAGAGLGLAEVHSRPQATTAGVPVTFQLLEAVVTERPAGAGLPS